MSLDDLDDLEPLFPPCRWWCSCGWTGFPKDMIVGNHGGGRVCPECGSSGGLETRPGGRDAIARPELWLAQIERTREEKLLEGIVEALSAFFAYTPTGRAAGAPYAGGYATAQAMLLARLEGAGVLTRFEAELLAPSWPPIEWGDRRLKPYR